MTVLQMLPEVVGPKKFLGLIAFTKFVDDVQMTGPLLPIRLGFVGEFSSAVPTGVSGSWWRFWLTGSDVDIGQFGGREKGSNKILGEDRARP